MGEPHTPEAHIRLASQPLGIAMGLNDVRSGQTALLLEITDAVAAAKDGSASRREIFNRFAHRASKATIYRCLDAAISSTGAKLAPTKLSPRSGDVMSEAAQEAELDEVRDAVEEIERLVAGGKAAEPEPLAHQAAPDPSVAVLAPEPVKSLR
jgi:hypothetical protein